MIYNNIELTLLNNGNTGGFFNIEGGVRQGCPLSADLFIIAIEIFANKTRHEKDIKGIRIDKEEIKLSMIADDLTLVLHNLKSLENAFNLLEYF